MEVDGCQNNPIGITIGRGMREPRGSYSTADGELFNELYPQDSYETIATVDDDIPSDINSIRSRKTRSFPSTSRNSRTALLEARISAIEDHIVPAVNSGTFSRNLEQGSEVDGDGPAGSALNGAVEPSIDESVSSASKRTTDVICEICEEYSSDFTNKYENRTEEYAIEVLKGLPDSLTSAKHPDKAERSSTKDNGADQNVQAPKRTPGATAVRDLDPRQMPERIRINSPHILNALASIDRHIDSSGPFVMDRPFKVLSFHESRIREYVRRAEFDCRDHHADDEGKAQLLHLQHVRCLVKFIDQYIIPTTSRFQNNETTHISFKDLWYIFPPGEDVFMPLKRLRGTVFKDAMDTTPETFIRRYNMLWRVTGCGGGRPNLIERLQNHDGGVRLNPFKINCYYVDFDGRFFLPVTHVFAILPFKGEVPITSLDFFPIRFMKDGDKHSLEHTNKGAEIFRTIATGFNHFYYSGLTMVTHPCGCHLQSDAMHQEQIDSEVIVDFKMALQSNPSWRPTPSSWKAPPRYEGELQERTPVYYWTNTKRKKLISTQHDYIHDDYHIDREMAVLFRDNEQIFSPIPSGWASNAEMVPQKDVGLLAGRVFAFVLRTRSFAALWLWSLSPIKSQKESLNNLQLRDNSFKDTIQKLVNAHFKQAQHFSKFEYDVIQGKGKGLIILLHGAPGVGKTSTAESVAAASGRPLFQITTGDLGLTPGEVEKALKKIFRFAQTWNCVLLLDECDIFLAQRMKNDITRNGLVSVFLRTLEFYTGVLFLTTNRVGVLDEAIKSRLTYTVHYPPLDGKQTRAIWEVNLRLLRDRHPNLDVDESAILDWAREHFQKHKQDNSCWSGRQIQNAFKVAAALADYDEESSTGDNAHDLHPGRPKLYPEHFEIIARGTQAFDEYLREATGQTDAERAYNDMVRADHKVDMYPQGDAHSQFEPNDHYSRSPSTLHIQPGRKASSSHFLPLQEINSPQGYHAATSRDNHRRNSSGRHIAGHSPSPHEYAPTKIQIRNRRASSNLTAVHTAISSSSWDIPTVSPRSSGYLRNSINERESQSGPSLGQASLHRDDDFWPTDDDDAVRTNGLGLAIHRDIPQEDEGSWD